MSRSPTPCPCGSGESLAACCGRYLTGGGASAPTAEKLMRSRYTAFAVGDMDHLTASWHRSTRPIALRDDPTTRWTGLEVLATTGGGLFDAEGTVTFRAHFRRKQGHGRREQGHGRNEQGHGRSEQGHGRSTRGHGREGGRDDVLAETSRFVREDGRWLYVEPV